MAFDFSKYGVSARKVSIGFFFVALATAICIPLCMIMIASSATWLYFIRVPNIPVVLIQIFLVLVSSALALSSSLVILEWIFKKINPFKKEKLNYIDHIMLSALFLISVLASALYYFNIIAIVFAVLVLWLGRSKIWRILGVAAIILNIVIQFALFFTVWR
ncbi:MAG: hypothetical protein H7644_12085 [Candidatus Heimdallarchaeota archaeon]|nr:hypothetical protein [Candidatus Heimdallarchaeota archaeon]MCK5144500.1 hypothetical protein [Candidatus Heimdallarchaeota archaeon]